MNIENIIKILKESFQGADFVYTNGSCYQLYVFLKNIFPDIHPLITDDGQHIIIKQDDKYYDINGVVSDISNLREMTEKEIEYYTTRRCNIYSPSFFVPQWVEDSCIPFLQTASFAFNLDDNDAAPFGYKLVPIESETEYELIESALFSANNASYEPYAKSLKDEQKTKLEK